MERYTKALFSSPLRKTRSAWVPAQATSEIVDFAGVISSEVEPGRYKVYVWSLLQLAAIINGLAGVILTAIIALLVAGPAAADTVTVTTNADVLDGETASITLLQLVPGEDGQISLREAITAANNTVGPDEIRFAGTGVEVYTFNAALPPIDDMTGGTTFLGDGRIRFWGTGLGVDGTGLELRSSNNLVRGITFYNFGSTGILVTGVNAVGNIIQGCRFGAPDNKLNRGNRIGISLSRASRSLVGGAAEGEGNVFCDNEWAIVVNDYRSSANVIQGNIIGIDPATDYVIANTGGVAIGSSSGTLLGGAAPGEGNVISACTGMGVTISGELNQNTVVQGNIIGLDIAGRDPVGNGYHGIYVFSLGLANLRIGGPNPGEGNIISGNGLSGIFIYGEGSARKQATIQGNFIGTDRTGMLARGNDTLRESWGGVYVFQGQNLLIGGTDPGAGNLISGNWGDGILVEISLSTTIQGNRIGLNAVGLPVLGNYLSGVYATGSNTVVGGTSPGAANEIAGNQLYGINYDPNNDFLTYRQNSIHGNGWAGIGRLFGGPYLDVPVLAWDGANAVQGTAVANAAVELFADLEDEGQYYLATVTADAQGNFSAVLPASAFSGYNITATATAGGHTSEFSEPLPVPAGVHSSDTDLNGKVSLSELLRLVQFYNVGGYGCDLSGEDGYSPGPGSTACPRHATDYAPTDWQISLSELLRAIQFYNLAGYTPCDEGEDGFCPAD